MNNNPNQQTAQAATLDKSNIGKVGVCSIGKVGVVTGIDNLGWGLTYIGINLNDGTRWASRKPLILTDTVAEFIERREAAAHRKGQEGRPLYEPPIFILYSNLN